jgi:hypothetical protein
MMISIMYMVVGLSSLAYNFLYHKHVIYNFLA